MPERTEISNSLDIARNADDILEWVEQALDECLTESRESADQANGDTLPDSVDVSAASDECLAESIEENATRPSMVDDKNASWLLETNIEIVRLVEAPDEKIERSLTSLTASHVDSENSYQSPSDGDEAAKMAALITALKYDNHTTTNNEIAAVTHTVPNTNSALPNETTNLGSQSQNPVPLAEAGNKPECLGYLLGHLRQLREGTSS